MRAIVLGTAVMACGLAGGYAQAPVGRLENLVGARAGQAENEVVARGYRNVGGEHSGGASYTYWREESSNRCVSIRTADGRYEAIVYAPDSDCANAEQGGQHAESHPNDGSFASVCGVVADDREYRYHCRVKLEGCQGEGYCRTIVTYPDLELKLTWHKDNHATVESAGVNPQETTSTFDQGLTKFNWYDKAYFFYGTKERAEKEAAKFKG